MPDIAIVSNDTPAPAARTPPANHSAWLEQLESAQWQQRLRYQPNGGQQPSGGQASFEGADKAPARQTVSSAPFEHDVRSSAGSNAAVKPAGAAGGNATGAGVTAREAVMHPAAASQPAPQPSLQQRPVALGSEQQSAPLQPLRRLPGAQWQAQHAHLMAGTDGVRMWLRDARYDGRDGYRLLRALRSEFARLGLRLARFTLNGTEITEPNRVD